MNDQHSPGPGQAAGPTAPASDAAVSLRRRRLLKIGAGAAPTALLLVGRPVHAQSLCVTTSAWGSYQVNMTASVEHRMQSKGRTIVAWTISDWRNDSARSALGRPWNVAFQTGLDTRRKVKDAGLAVLPASVDVESTIVDVLAIGDFRTAMLVALLNAKYANSADGPLSCVDMETLNKLSTGIYTLPSGGTWTPPQITAYLQGSGLAAP